MPPQDDRDHRFISNEVFDAVSEYIITKPQLCGKTTISMCAPSSKNFFCFSCLTFVSRTAFDHVIVGSPMCVEGRKYHRNALLWNLAFVLSPGTPSDMYKPILRKLGFLLRTLEVSVHPFFCF
jgi:hypothetical protein